MITLEISFSNLFSIISTVYFSGSLVVENTVMAVHYGIEW